MDRNSRRCGRTGSRRTKCRTSAGRAVITSIDFAHARRSAERRPQLNSASLPVLVLEPSKGFVRLNLRDVWAYRELLYFLIWRDVKVRYKQTVLGAAWAILQPVMAMVVFSIFFGRFA